MLTDQEHNELILALKKKKKVQSYVALVEVHYLEEEDADCTVFKCGLESTSGSPLEARLWKDDWRMTEHLLSETQWTNLQLLIKSRENLFLSSL